MAANSLEGILDRVSSLVVSAPFQYALSSDPITFERMPTQAGEVWVRVEGETVRQVGGFSYTSDDTSRLTMWVARKTTADAQATYRHLWVDATSLTSALVRDGATGGGDYSVEDGRAVAISRRPGDDYTVLRLSVPVRYEAAL